MPDTMIKVRSADEIEAVKALVWEFFDFLRVRYPELKAEMDQYLKDQDVAGQLENFADVFLPPNGECFLSYHQGKPVGIVMLKRIGDSEGEMNRMYVRQTARGLGLGRKLGAAVVDEARALGVKTLKLDALHRHVEALPLYESLGFERYKDPKTFQSSDERFIHMKMAL
jgi:GNAT superfamily N-acetyltransferase